jgi:hypothetical protein
MWRCIRRTALACLVLMAPPLLADEVKIGDTISAGIQTRPEHDARPFGYRVTWIAWDSAFRDTDLRLGDRILGVNGERYTPEAYSMHHAIGDWAESGYWEKEGAAHGDPVTLIVERDGEEIEIEGRLSANRFYYNDQGRQVMGPGGPDRSLPEKDADGRRLFDGSWASWYEDKTGPKPGSWSYILDGGWERSAFSNRKELAAHLADQERIDHLALHYPGPFTDAVRHDFERVRAYLEGTVVELPPEALAYRTRAEQVRKAIGGYAGQAIAALEAELGDRLEKAPSARNLDEQREAYAGKVVYFDGLGYRNIINDLDQTFMVAGGGREGYYFLEAESPAMARAFDALYRYRALVDPKLAERFSVWIAVEDEPRIITYQGSPTMGLLGKVVAIAGGRHDVFIDARQDAEDFAFAGERETEVEPSCAITAEDPPEATVACMVEALKAGDRDTWQSLFAEWRFTPLRDGVPPLYDPDYRLRPAIFESAWQDSREAIMDDVHDARVSRVERIETLYEPAADEPFPKVEAVRILLDHVGLIDNEYRTFTDLTVRRVWRLQRRDGGPWKIVDVQHL